MVPTLLLCSGLMVAAVPTPADRVDYEAAQVQAGRDSTAHVKLALWCEQHGMTAERAKHLALAVLIDPKNGTARGLMGLVAVHGRWQRPERVEADATLAAALAAYNGRRDRMANSADAHWKMALWCDANGLKAEAIAHWTAVTRREPGREAAWKRLGYKKHQGRWMTEAQIAAEKDGLDAQRKADKYWKPRLVKWRAWLLDKNKRAEAEALLANVTDPRAIPAIWAAFVTDGGDHIRAVRLLSQIDAPASSRTLAILAVFSPSAEARRTATESLQHRDIREVVGWLIALIRKPLKYEVRPVNGPGSPGVLFVEGQKANIQRLYSPPSLPSIPLFPGEPVTYDGYGLPVVSRMVGIFNEVTGFEPVYGSLQAQRAALGAQNANVPHLPNVGENTLSLRNRYGPNRLGVETTVPVTQSVQIPVGEIVLQYEAAAATAAVQLQNDVATVYAFNAGVTDSNGKVVGVLNALTGQDLGDDQQVWASWWTDQQGYAFTPTADPPKPTILEDVPLEYQPQGVPLVFTATQSGPPTSFLAQTGHSCFRAGTPVRTFGGLRPIESIKLGDQALVEDPVTGALSYEPVIAVFHNRPARLYGIDLEGETVWATGIHRFWKLGHGWVMARELKPGDTLRSMGGTLSVRSVVEGPVEPVFNLEIAGGSSFFVGTHAALVHDNSLVQPVPEPFDAPPVLQTAHAE
ncbi:MAG: polymorphic toxin-type HINT domain-containing protein [Isosphaeraceae bacterium]|nr:polymorphic toxin-type HINT domain-containing protein [Isosphaeraceae bacterium]